jgi:NADPH-dependent curcumin reductase
LRTNDGRGAILTGVTTYSNERIVLASRPTGSFRTTDLRAETVEVGAPEPGHVIVAVDTLSIDAFIRTALDEGSYHMTVPMGGVITALGVGTVVDSADEALQPGDKVFGPLGAQQFAAFPAAMLRKLDVRSVPASAYLGALGMTTGLTAYFGIFEIGKVAAGDVVVVSGAAGAVGSMAGQLARIAGAGKVIGIAGGPKKGALLVDELGFDAAIDYKNEDVSARLRELAPDGVDVFFDNVGGPILDAVLFDIRMRGRVVICGAISQYEKMDNVAGPTNYLKLAERYARMEGFNVMFFGERYGEAETALGGWMAEGRLRMHETVLQGVASFPTALATLLSGGHEGKLLVQVS